MADVTPSELADSDIAIVGMSGRFPGAPDVDRLWERIVRGEDCLVDLDEEALRADGVPDEALRSPNYVRRNGVLADVEGFDPAFFGIGPRDAAIMDPQQRHFLECAWHALESAGHDPQRFAGAIGVFAGCGMNTYMLNNLLTNQQLVDQVGMFLLRHTGNDKDFLSTTLSYRLDLRGPSVNVQTACSTSLVAVHLAVQSLLALECDLALAGGSTIEVPHRHGYFYQEGEILAPDGVCRAFDEKSGGTVLTSGVGVVALRRLADALEAGDPILAVIKGTAINNDGQRKVGYLAPSVDGHADVIREALAVSGLSARDIGLFEAHGTGTAVGDPIEFAAATEAFRASTDETQYCRLVSTKPNIGHLDTAAGVASLIKVVQALRHRTLPPLANHSGPSPLLDLEHSPFVLSDIAEPWPGDRPRRAGVSSLGVGGTNAHVIVEEAPPRPPSPAASPEQLLVLSGQEDGIAKEAASRLADHLEAHRDVNLADVAFTLATRRRHFDSRRVVAVTDTSSAIDVLRSNSRDRVATSIAPPIAPKVVFMFPGGGSQYNGMGAGLDERFGVYHEVMADGIERVKARSGVDLAPLLRPDAPADALRHPTTSLPAVFLTSVALARQWMAWGVEPAAMVGHSLGEYTAAHLAGVLTLDGALDLIVARSALMERATGVDASMLAVPLPSTDVENMLGSTLSMATINAADECVVAGPAAEVDALRQRLESEGVTPTLIPLSAAAHSSLLDPVLPEFLAVVETVTLAPPTVPYLSNLSGTWITPDQATSPRYWVDHLRNTVRFSDNLAAVLADGPTVLVELGPGHSLSSYARRQPEKPVAAIPSLRHPNQHVADTAAALLAVGRLWAAGVEVDLTQFCGTGRQVVTLPGYPFRRTPHWIEPGAGRRTSVAAPSSADAVVVPQVERIPDLADSFWSPAWREAGRQKSADAPTGAWVVVGDAHDELAVSLVDRLAARGVSVELCEAPPSGDIGPVRAIVVVGGATDVGTATDRWLTDSSEIVKALGAASESTLFAAVTRGALAVDGPAANPVDAMALGLVGTAPREYDGIRTVMVDVEEMSTADSIVDEIIADLLDGSDQVVAHRDGRRFVPHEAPIRLEQGGTTFRRGGTYAVTGALGGVGFALSKHLLEQHAVRLVVVASQPIPEGAERLRWLATHAYDDATSRRIRRLADLEAVAEAVGTAVAVVVADLDDRESVAAALDDVEARVGPLDGAIHAAGALRDRLIEMATPEDHAAVVGAKARGGLALVEELARRDASLLVLVSSTSTSLMPEGQAAYVAANSVLDALAGQHDALRVVTINFGVWAEQGIAATLANRLALGLDVGEPIVHPVLSELSVAHDGTRVVTGSLAAHHHWVVDEHRGVNGVALLPATGHLELYLAAIAAAGIEPMCVDSVTFLEPLVVPDGVTVTLRLTLPASADGGLVSLESDGGTGRWRAHSEAELRRPEPLQQAAIDASAPRGADSCDPIAHVERGLRLGPRWHADVIAWRSDGAVGGSIELSEHYADEVDAWIAHPAIVDVAVAFAVQLGTRRDALYVPIGVDRVQHFGAVTTPAMVSATRLDTSTDDVLRVDLSVADRDGRVALRLAGLSLRPLEDAATLGLLAVDTEHDLVTHRIPPILALSMRGGIRAVDGTEMLERVVASDRSRVIASTLDLADVRGLLEPSPAAPTPVAGQTAPSSGGTSVAEVVRQMFTDLLGVADVGPDDDFFELGGHSLIAIRLMSRIHKELGVRFQLATIFEASTVDSLADLVLAERPNLDDELAAAATAPDVGALVETTTATTPAFSSLVTISASGDGEPLYIVHGAGGNVLFLWSLARAMAGSRPIYGFQAFGVDGANMPDPSVERMAARYVDELRAHRPGPYLLGGYSGGGIVTFEMVRQLRELGEDVRCIVLFDSVPPGRAEPPPKVAMRNLVANIRRHGFQAMRPFMAAHVRESLRRFVPARAERAAQLDADRRDLGLGDTHDLGFVNLFYYFSAAADRYEMTTIDVDAILLKAEWVWPLQPHDYYWGRHINGDIEIAEVPGDHNAMFFPENAPHLATILQQILDRRGL